LAQPALYRQRLNGYGQIMVQATSEMLAPWDGMAAAGSPMDIRAEMSRLALAIAGRVVVDENLATSAADRSHLDGSTGTIPRSAENCRIFGLDEAAVRRLLVENLWNLVAN
jgi:cytochrome P450